MSRRVRSARAATIIEYVLLLGVFTVSVLIAIQWVTDDVEDETSSTAHDIGGEPRATTTLITTTTGSGATTTMPDNDAPVVYAGPDHVVYPGTWTLQDGTFSDTDTPLSLLDVEWSVQSPGTTRNTIINLGDTSTEIRFDRPGTYIVRLTVSDGVLDGSDTAEIKVTSGVVSVDDLTISGWWDDWTATRWNAQARAQAINEFDEPVAGVTIWGEWKRDDGVTVPQSCVTDGNGYCWWTLYSIPSSVGKVEFEFNDVTGPAGCFDGWDGNDDHEELASSGIPVPPSTTTTTAGPTTSSSSTSSSSTSSSSTASTTSTTTTIPL